MVNLNYRIRRLVIAALIIVILVFIGLLVSKIFFAGEESRDRVILSGNGYSSLDYQVALSDNDIYEEKFINDRDYYLFPFTKYIKFYASAGANVPGADYLECVTDCKIYLMSKIEEDGSLVTVWSKEYECMNEKSEISDTGVIDINREYSVFFDEYIALIDDLAENHQLYTTYELHFVFSGDIIVEKDGKRTVEAFDSSAVINMNDVVYQVNVLDHDNINVQVTQNYTARKDVDWYAVLVFLGMVLIFFSMLSYVLMRTVPVREVDVYYNKVTTIKREYSSRLAELSKTLTYQASVMISIEEFEDLIKIADEIGQMVFYYEVNESDERKIEFYVFDDARIYYLVMFG